MMLWNENGLFTQEHPAEDSDYSVGYDDYLIGTLTNEVENEHPVTTERHCKLLRN